MNPALSLQPLPRLRVGLLLTLTLLFWLASAVSLAPTLAPTLARAAASATETKVCTCAHCSGGAHCCSRAGQAHCAL